MRTTPGMRRMKNPAHPGGFVKSEIIEAAGLSVTRAAAALGVTRPALSALPNERASLSPEMALRIEKAFGVSMDTLLRMQTSYDIARTRMREGDIELVPLERRLARTRLPTRVVARRGRSGDLGDADPPGLGAAGVATASRR